MTDDLHFGGMRYIPAGEAAAQVGLTRDYISKLCRDEKVQARRIGKNWFVEPQSLFSFLGTVETSKLERIQKLSEERRKEYHGLDISHAPAKIFTPRPVVIPVTKVLLDGQKIQLSQVAQAPAPIYEKVKAVATNIFPDHDSYTVPK